MSTTLYNALLLSNLQIDERHNHTRPIAYVDIGTDAPVVEGYKDLKFTNNLPHRIYLKSEADGKKLTFQVFGNKADKIYDVEIFTKLLGVESPKTVKKNSHINYMKMKKKLNLLEQKVILMQLIKS